MLTDRERTATKDVCVVPKTLDSKMVLLVRRTLPERERMLCSLYQNESLFSFTHASSPFPVMDIWEFSANLIVFFLFIYLLLLFLILDLFIYLFVPYKFLENRSNFFHHYSRSAFLGEKRLIKNNRYIKTILNSNKILSENFKPISAIKLEIIG